MFKRYRKLLTAALLFMNLSGVRVVHVNGDCGHARSYFAPSMGVRAIAKTIRKSTRPPRDHDTLGFRSTARRSQSLDSIQADGRVQPTAAAPAFVATVAAGPERRNPRCAWKLPKDLDPVQPAHLYSKL